MPTTHVPKKASLKFIKGSHKWNKWFIPRLFKSNENYQITSEVMGDEGEICDIESIQDCITNIEDVLQWEVKVIETIFVLVCRLGRMI